jgi:multidrug resistance efflux pump
MGWARTLLLGDIGNRLDIADAEAGIASLQRAHDRAERELESRERDITVLKQELGRQKLAIQALTRFLIEKGVVATAELDDFIAQIDAEDGVVDGRMELDSRTGRLRFPEKKVPDGTFRKMDGSL